MKKVSIIMPVYNSGQYLCSSLESVANQSFPLNELELIAVDDFSTDSSLKVLKDYKLRAPFSMRLIGSNKNKGASATRNTAIDYSNGDLLLFLDSDDLIHPDCVSECVNAFEKDRKVGFVYTDHSAIKPGAKFPLEPKDIIYIKEKPNFEINHFLKGDYNYVGAVRTVKKDLNLPFDESLPCAEDADWIIRLGLSGVEFKHVPKSLYYWRRGILSSLTGQHLKEDRKKWHDLAFRKTK